MYIIVGGDGNEYGPVSVEDIRQWIAEGRVNGQTRLRAADGSEWTTVGNLPEFTEALVARYAPPTVPPPLGSPQAVFALDTAMTEGPRLSASDCIGRGWQTMRSNFALFLGASFVVLFLNFALGFVPFIGGIVSMVIQGALLGGLFLLILRRVRGEPASLNDAFVGFGPRFVPLMMTGLLIQVLVFLGFLFCIIPGIYLTVAWKFALPLVIDKNMDFWPAMETSRRAITRNFLPVLLILLLVNLPLILWEGYSAVYTFRLLMPVFESGNFDLGQLSGAMGNVVKLAFVRELLLWLCTPLAFASLMHAYEDLSRTRSSTTA